MSILIIRAESHSCSGRKPRPLECSRLSVTWNCEFTWRSSLIRIRSGNRVSPLTLRIIISIRSNFFSSLRVSPDSLFANSFVLSLYDKRIFLFRCVLLTAEWTYGQWLVYGDLSYSEVLTQWARWCANFRDVRMLMLTPSIDTDLHLLLSFEDETFCKLGRV